jgi:hypothetical protein
MLGSVVMILIQDPYFKTSVDRTSKSVFFIPFLVARSSCNRLCTYSQSVSRIGSERRTTVRHLEQAQRRLVDRTHSDVDAVPIYWIRYVLNAKSYRKTDCRCFVTQKVHSKTLIRRGETTTSAFDRAGSLWTSSRSTGGRRSR